MIVVADTSAISNLMAIGRESILRDLFGQVIVPPVVHKSEFGQLGYSRT